MNEAILILGNQLFPLEKYQDLTTKKVFMAEDNGLCTHYKYHKHKIIFFLASMRNYRDLLRDQKFDVHYVDGEHEDFLLSFEDKLKKYLEKEKIHTLHCYEIEDQFFENRIQKFCLENSIDLEIRQSPMFLCSRESFKKYLKGKKRPFMKTFYEEQRKELGILVEKGKPVGGRWSFDDENRKKLPKGHLTPPLPGISRSKNVEDVKKFVTETFPDHPGESENFWLPTCRKESLEWLENFVRRRLCFFGAYEDAISRHSDFVYHSVLSPMINIGFLLPEEVVMQVLNAHFENKELAPINSVEGIVRQIIGWREFVRGIYQNFAEHQWNTNFFDHKRKMKKCWYTGETGIEILDDVIKKTVKYSYNHHIERLMVLSNLMLLSEIHPHQIYAWFMEMYSDSSDWVMGPNVFGMGQFSDGGVFATKPYTCSSNYLLKMSDYKKEEWCEVVDGLYWRFIQKHRDFYSKNPRLAMMTRHLDRMDLSKKKKIFALAEEFIERTTY